MQYENKKEKLLTNLSKLSSEELELIGKAINQILKEVLKESQRTDFVFINEALNKVFLERKKLP